MRVTCVAVDFDGTLAHFKGGYDGLFAIFSRRGVDPAVVRECYEQTKQEVGFSISVMISMVAGRSGCCFDAAGVGAEFRDWLGLSLMPYADSVATLAAWRRQGIPVVILTAGNREYQAQKVQATHMPHDQLIVVSTEHEKPNAVRQLLEQYGAPILLVEDRPSVLDRMRGCSLTEKQLVTVRLLRKESPYCRENAACTHQTFETLEDVASFVKK